jgi:hypothetical protein
MAYPAEEQTQEFPMTTATLQHGPRTLCRVPVPFIEAEAQHRVDQLTAETHSENRDEASHARRRLNAINKALLHVMDGITVRESLGDYLIASGTRAGMVHRVSQRYGCSCEAAQKGHPCWHSELADLLAAWSDEVETERAAA